jgi:uncharacterized protein (TIGR02118 family)
MLKVCELVKKRPDLSLEDFRAHWREVHGPIVAAIPGLRRYVQSHPLMGGYRKGPLVFDGIAEVWVDDKDALRAMSETPEFATAKADEPNFIDPAELIELVVDEHVIKDGPVPDDAIKSIEFVTFAAGMSPAEGQTYWRHVHGPIAREIPSVRRYVQSHVRLGAYDRPEPPPYDGLAITWFESIDAKRAGVDTEAYRRTRNDEPNFLPPGHLPVILAKEQVFVE